ncbi:MAG TPA: DUF2167 domain-containing protein, partial [Gemmatimonadaceae bacterium]|nr:DUF2167 domain-containing protein [Gemmatimonadaceae bacterium]
MRAFTWRHIAFLGCLLGVPTAAMNAQQTAAEKFSEIAWEKGPAVGSLGNEATVRITDGCTFTGVEGTRKFLTLTQNPWSGDERGTALCQIVRQSGDSAQWFAIFEFDGSGYVKDDEKAELDADKMLASLRRGNEAANKTRKERGWGTLELVGWEKAPFYDPATNNLTWAMRVRADDGGESINHSVRLLGRRGVMKVDLVVAPENYSESLTGFTALIADHEYNSG